MLIKIIKVVFVFLLLVLTTSSFTSAEAGYSHVNSKGKTYYLYKKEVSLKNSDQTRTIYFFAKSPENKKGTALLEVPSDRVVSETKTGLLVLKKKSLTKAK